MQEPDSALADYFRDPDSVLDSPVAWQLDANAALVDAMRLLFQGASGLVRLRLWMLLALVGQGKAFLTREELDRLFYAVRSEAVDSVLKRFREANLLTWDDSARQYGLTPLAQQVASMLGALGQNHEDELAGLLSQVVGADQLGTLEGNQVHMLQAQLVRLHHEFADAIASGSEFRLREARKRYDRASRLIDKASDTITTIIGSAKGQRAMEQAARGLGQAQSKLLAMASQFNRALQQVDRQRVTLGTTGITSTDVKRWLQTQPRLDSLLHDALHSPVGLAAFALHEMLDVAEAEFERDRPQAQPVEALPQSQTAPEGDLTAVALPTELGDLSALLAQWVREDAQYEEHMQAQADAPASSLEDREQRASETAPPVRAVHAALVGLAGADARYAQVAYKAQLLPLLGDAQAQELPGATGDLARQPWRVQWNNTLKAVKHPAVSHISGGTLVPAPLSPLRKEKKP
ncbi:hypothetical protein EXZ61_09980 [Rhodoferax aquaticus]|uniref:Uncharacterized protein n=1 Tax=Rhodoferax aquaticus TaxID=2527691 RepID=A0A515EVU0_9BURK|nr:hypothetical protein EXZ61_09980 [Rhodoferax aquaticus]